MHVRLSRASSSTAVRLRLGLVPTVAPHPIHAALRAFSDFSGALQPSTPRYAGMPRKRKAAAVAGSGADAAATTRTARRQRTKKGNVEEVEEEASLHPAAPAPARLPTEEGLRGQQRVVRLDAVMREWKALRARCAGRLQETAAASPAAAQAATAAPATRGPTSAAPVVAASAALGRAPQAGSSSPSSSSSLLATDVSPPQRALLLSAIAAEAQRYPSLHAAFHPRPAVVKAPHAPTTSPHGAVPWRVEGEEAVVANERDMGELLTLLRLYGVVMQQQQHQQQQQQEKKTKKGKQQPQWQRSEGAVLHSTLWTSVIDALTARVRDRDDVTANVAPALQVLVAVYREQLALGAGIGHQLQTRSLTAVAGESQESVHSSAETTSTQRRNTRKLQAMRAQSDEETAVQTRVAHVLTSLVAALHESQSPAKTTTRAGRAPPVDAAAADGAASTAVMLVAMAAVATEAAGLLARTSLSLPVVQAAAEGRWRDWRDASLQHLVQSLDGQVVKSAVTAAGVVVDMLRCLRWTEELEAVLSVSTLGKVSELCQRTLLRTCRVADQGSGPHLFELLCDPTVAAALSQLSPDRVTYAQAAADLCAVATAFARQRPARLEALLSRVEKKHHVATAAATALPVRPPLRSPAVQLMYAMLCSGYSAATLLTSDLCLSLPPRDTLDAVRVADLFSLQTGTSPLPVRTRGVVVDQVIGLLTQCRRDRHRVVNSSVDEEVVHAPFALTARLADGAAAPVAASAIATNTANLNAAAAPSKLRRGKRRGSALAKSSVHCGGGDGGGGGGAPASPATAGGAAVLTPAVYRAQVNHALYVTHEAIVECLMRGDVAAVDALCHALLPLLQQEGREAALTAALESLWDAFRGRLMELGSSEHTHLPPPFTTTQREGSDAGGGRRQTLPQTSPAMEEALAVLSARFLPYMTESVLKMLTGGAFTLSSGVPATGPTSQPATSSGSGGGGAPLRGAELVELALRLSTIAVLAGMPSGTVAHLTTLHNGLLKFQARAIVPAAAASSTATANTTTTGSVSGVAAAFTVVERLERFLTDLTRLALPWSRHPQSAHVRLSGVAVQHVLSVYLCSTAAVARDVAPPQAVSSSSTGGAVTPAVAAPYRHYLLTSVHLLYRLATEYPVEAEPPSLRHFRVDVLDPALTAVLLPPPAAPSLTIKGGAKATTPTGTEGGSHVPATTVKAALQLPLTTLTEVVVVMCVPESVQHVSLPLLRGVAASVQRHLETRQAQQTAPTSGAVVADTATGVLATQLLCSGATVCLRADDTLTALLLQMLAGLCPLLSLWQATTVLTRLHATGAPLAAAPARGMISRLVEALRVQEQTLAAPTSTAEEGAESKITAAAHPSTRSTERLRNDQSIHLLHTLCAIQRTADAAVAEQRWQPSEDADVAALLRLLRTVPYSPLLKALTQPEILQQRRYSIQECGIMVEVVAHLLQTMTTTTTTAAAAESPTVEAVAELERGVKSDPARLSSYMSFAPHPFSADEAAALRMLPRTIAAYVLQAVQLPVSAHDVPALLRGYAALSSEADLQQQMLRAFIARTMRAAPSMTPAEVVESVEAYCAAGVFHEQLYGVLLGRAADMGRRLTLELSVRLLRCGTLARHPSVRTVCVTAVQPIFSAQVRGLLQSDPRTAVTVASTALAILHCLRDCFPHDDIGAAVLANVARHHHDASLPVVKTALELMERRGSTDYDVAQVLARHCIDSVLPTCAATELVNVTSLLLACGLRTATLLEAVYARLLVVMAAMPGSSLAKLSSSLLRAAVEVDTTVVQAICDRAVSLTTAANNGGSDEVREIDGDVAGTTTKSGKKGAAKKIAAAAAAAKGRQKATAATTTNTTAVAVLPMPLTVPQVCVFLRLLRSVSRRLVTTAMTTTDAVLLYVQTRVEADAAQVRDAAPGAESTDATQLCCTSPLFHQLQPRDVEEMLRCCVDLSSRPKAFAPLVQRLADHLGVLLDEVQRSETWPEGLQVSVTSAAAGEPASTATHLRRRRSALPASPSAAGTGGGGGAADAEWSGDLILLVDLGSLLIRLGEADHHAVKALYSVLYERRAALLQRALLVKTTRQALELGGRAVHPDLYKLIVDGEML